MIRHRSRCFLFGSFSFVNTVETVDNFAVSALYKMFFHTAVWKDRAGGGGAPQAGPCEKPVAKISPASCPCGFRKDRTLSWASTRIAQDGSGNQTQPIRIIP